MKTAALVEQQAYLLGAHVLQLSCRNQYATMFKGIVGSLTMLTFVGRCTTRYCEEHDEADLRAPCLINKEVVEKLIKELSEQN